MQTSFGVVILCGGRSSRMGRDKAELSYGQTTFLAELLQKMRSYPELLISANRPDDYAQYGVPVASDVFPHCGPMAGIHAALTMCRSDALLCLPCDVPLFTREFGDYLCAEMQPLDDALIVETRDGRFHPPCGVYRKRTAAIMERCLTEGKYKMWDALNQIRWRPVALEGGPFPDSILTNVNTWEEYNSLFKKQADSEGRAKACVPGVFI